MKTKIRTIQMWGAQIAPKRGDSWIYHPALSYTRKDLKRTLVAYNRDKFDTIEAAEKHVAAMKYTPVKVAISWMQKPSRLPKRR